jgi:hypothetical protein
MVSPNELTVSCSRGTLAISVDDDTKTIAEGTAYRVMLDQDGTSNGSGAPQQKPKRAGKNRFLLVVILFSSAAAAIALRLAYESPSGP